MRIDFRFEALRREQFEGLFKLSDEDLAVHHAKWVEVDAEPGYPCRVSLEDARVGERVLLVPHIHHDVQSPLITSTSIMPDPVVSTAPYIAPDGSQKAARAQ